MIRFNLGEGQIEDLQAFVDSQRDEIMEEMYNGIGEAVMNRRNEVAIFEIYSSLEYYAQIYSIPYTEYKKNLNECLNYYKDLEEYEACTDIMEYLKVHANNIYDEIDDEVLPN